MKYYKLEYNSLNIKETGTQFQCVNVEEIGDMQNNIFPLEGLIDFSFRLPVPIMESRAKPTTILSVIPINNRFLVLKNYFIDFLKNFDIGICQNWNIKVKHKKDYYDYYSLFILNYPLQKEIIDFENSNFYKGKYSNYLFIGENIKINDYNEYLNTQNNFQNSTDYYLKFKSITLDLSNLKTDMFCIYNFPFGGYYVSENLKNEIEKQKFTGIALKSIEEISDKLKIVY